MSMRTRILLSLVALTLLVAPYYPHLSYTEKALWGINAHAASTTKAQWAQVYWLKRQALASERCVAGTD